MKPIRYLLLLPLLFWLAGCRPAIQVTTEPAPDFRLSEYKTFAFFDMDAASEQGIGQAYATELAYLQQAIAAQLKQRGLEQTTSDPDLLVNLGIVVKEKVQTRETNILTDPPQYIGQRRYTWRSREIEVGRYQEGTVSVDFVNNERNELVWQGTAEAVLKSEPAKVQEQLQRGMAKLLQDIPL